MTYHLIGFDHLVDDRFYTALYSPLSSRLRSHVILDAAAADIIIIIIVVLYVRRNSMAKRTIVAFYSAF